jgi:hypothetical protein
LSKFGKGGIRVIVHDSGQFFWARHWPWKLLGLVQSLGRQISQ